MAGLTWSNLAWTGGGTGPVVAPDIFPESLESAARYELNTYWRCLAYKDGYVFAGSESTRLLTVFDARDLTQVKAIYRSSVPDLAVFAGGGYGIAFNHDNTILYMGLRRTTTAAVADGDAIGSVVAFSILNPADPVIMGSYTWVWNTAAVSSGAADMALVTDIAYFRREGRDYIAVAGNDDTAAGQGTYGQTGFCILDVTDPANMAVASFQAKRSNAYIRPHGVVVAGNRYAVTGNYGAGQQRIQLWDCADPANPALRSAIMPNYFISSLPNSGMIWGGANYPDSDTIVGFAAMNTRAMVTAGTEWAGLVMIDISDPDNIKSIGECRVPHDYVDTSATSDVPPRRVYFKKKSDRVWALMPAGENALHVIDCTDPANPVFMYNANFTGNFGVVMAHSCVMYELEGEDVIAIGDGHGDPSDSPTKGITMGRVEWLAS